MPTILLVEDDEMNSDMICRILQWEGYTVLTAGDGIKACALAASERPALILMDMGLPVLTGWEATARIKADPELRDTPIVALTAYAMPEDRQRSLEAGCDAFATKPIDFPSLLATIQHLLARRSAPGPL